MTIQEKLRMFSSDQLSDEIKRRKKEDFFYIFNDDSTDTKTVINEKDDLVSAHIKGNAQLAELVAAALNKIEVLTLNGMIWKVPLHSSRNQ